MEPTKTIAMISTMLNGTIHLERRFVSRAIQKIHSALKQLLHSQLQHQLRPTSSNWDQTSYTRTETRKQSNENQSFTRE